MEEHPLLLCFSVFITLDVPIENTRAYECTTELVSESSSRPSHKTDLFRRSQGVHHDPRIAMIETDIATDLVL